MYAGANIHVNHTTFWTFGCEVHGDGCPWLGVSLAHADHAAAMVVGDDVGVNNSSGGEVELRCVPCLDPRGTGEDAYDDDLQQEDSAGVDEGHGPYGEVRQVGRVGVVR